MGFEYDNTFIGCLAFIRHGRELGFTFDETRELLKIARYAEEPWGGRRSYDTRSP